MTSPSTLRTDDLPESAGGTASRSQGSDRTMAVIRIGVGLMWLSNINWKTPPNFGSDNGGGLYKFTQYAVSHPVFPPYTWVVEHLVLPNFQARSKRWPSAFRWHWLPKSGRGRTS